MRELGHLFPGACGSPGRGWARNDCPEFFFVRARPRACDMRAPHARLPVGSRLSRRHGHERAVVSHSKNHLVGKRPGDIPGVSTARRSQTPA
jgi:hypothetical protein